MQITPEVTLVKGRAANRYLIPDGKALTLIDTGLPGQAREIFQAAERLGYTRADLTRIVITHADYDHYGCLKAVRSECHARVYASQREAEAIERGDQSRPLKLGKVFNLLFQAFKFLYRVNPVPVDEILQEGDTLPLLGGLEVIETRGHTPGHISLFLKNEGILFCGDALRATSQDDLIPSHGINTWDEKLAWDAVKKLAEYRPEVICPGHGPAIRNKTALTELARSRRA